MRETSISSASSAKMRWLLSRIIVTRAMPTGLRPALPEKMTSSIFAPRSVFALCSPSTQRIASTTLLLPLPFGPTMAVTPGEKEKYTLSAKDLKPWISKDLRNMCHILSTVSFKTEASATTVTGWPQRSD